MNTKYKNYQYYTNHSVYETLYYYLLVKQDNFLHSRYRIY